MRYTFFIVCFFAIAKSYATQPYDLIYSFGEYHKGWALIQKNGLLGFINSKGEEIVAPQYEAIHDFGEYKKGWAMIIKNGKQGFINDKGEEVVAPQYEAVYDFG